VGGIVSDIFGGGSGGGGTTVEYAGTPSYTPTGQAGADQAWQSLLSSLQSSNPYPALIPSYNQYSTQQQNNPYASAAQAGAGTAGSTATTAGNELAPLAGLYSSEATSLQPYMTQILNMGLDPQQSLYNQQLQNTTDLANVTNAQYGLTGQQAAGSVNNALLNFNNQWQNQQLARALQGISGASTIGGAQTGLGGATQAAGTGASQLQAAGGAAPYNQYNSNLASILASISGQGTFGSGNTAQIANAMAEIIPYLNYGNGATNAGANALGANNAAAATQAAGLAGLAGLTGNAFSGLSNFFGGGSSAGTAVNAADPLAGMYGVSGTVGDEAAMSAADATASLSSPGFWSSLGSLIGL
jgi:hypothetical protein